MSAVGDASIVIDNYNYAHFLPQAIESALRQTYAPTEVIVVDDGSTDDSRAVIAGYGDRVRPVLKENRGQGSALNAGFAVSRGNVVLFLDADDVLLPTIVAEAVGFFRSSDVVKVHWPLWEIDAHGARTGDVIPGRPLVDGDLRGLAIEKGPISLPTAPTSGSAWSRAFLHQVLPIPTFDDKHGADAYLNTLAPVYGTIRRLTEPGGCYRVHSDSFSPRTTAADLCRDLARYDHHCKMLSAHLRRKGVSVDPERWKGPDSSFAWMRDMLKGRAELDEAIPVGSTFILVDEDQLGDTFLEARRALPFVERDGRYWGPPPSDEAAVQEFERLRRAGASFIVFVRSTFWWLEHYPALRGRLTSTFPRLLQNERVLVFDLRQGGDD